MSQIHVISVGGSLIAPPDGVDIVWLKKFRAFVLKRIKQGDKFILVCGGGAIARDYINSARKIKNFSSAEGDYLGIAATRLNAQLVKTIFGNLAPAEVITDPNKGIIGKNKIIISGGYRAGNSTDYIAVLLAKKNKLKTVINLSNIDCVYTKHPRLFPEAKKIEKIDWSGFCKIVGTSWSPGKNTPFDPIASQEARKAKLTVAILNGKKLANLEKFLDGRKFVGTVIK